jgi:hypothetical protein
MVKSCQVPLLFAEAGSHQSPSHVPSILHSYKLDGKLIHEAMEKAGLFDSLISSKNKKEVYKVLVPTLKNKFVIVIMVKCQDNLIL